MKRRFFSIAMALTLLCSLLPTAALADSTNHYEVTLEGFASANGSIAYSTDNTTFYAMDSADALTWTTTESGSNTLYSVELESETDIYIRCTPEPGYTVRSSCDNRILYGEEDAVYTFQLTKDTAERVFFTANDLSEANTMAKGTIYNPAYTTTALQSQIAELEDDIGGPFFYATDAYGNRLGDEVTIARGGSFFLRFKVDPVAKGLMEGGDAPDILPHTYTDLSQLFGNVGWNLKTIDGVIAYTNEEPSEDNNWSGGIHIDTLANCGKTVYLDFYISPKRDMGPGNPPVNWATMSQDYVIKKVIKITVEDSSNTSGVSGDTSISMTKPIPEGYSLTAENMDTDTLSGKTGYISGNVENHAVELTMKNGSAEYPVTNNSVEVAMPLPAALAGCAAYTISYFDPVSDKIKVISDAAPTVNNGTLSFATTHFSDFLVTGAGGAKISDTDYANLNAAASAAQENDIIIMQVDGTLTQSTNHVPGVTINKNGHSLKIAGGSHTFEITAADLASHRVVTESGGVYTVSKDTHTITFDSTGGSSVAQAVVTCEDAVYRPADPTRVSFSFAGWYSDETLTAAYDFASPVTGDMTLYAKWNAVSTGGGSAPGVTVPVSSDGDSVSVSATLSGSTANVNITQTQLDKLLSNSENSGLLTVNVSGLKNVDSAKLPAKIVTAANSDAHSIGLAAVLPTGSIALDAAALAAVNTGKDVSLSIEAVSKAKLAAAQKEALGDQADTAIVVDVHVLVGGVKTSTFGDGILTISIPYTPKSGEDTSKLTIWNIKDDGTIENMGGHYDAVNKCFVFNTTHLSQYALVRNPNPFTDIAEGAYYYDAVAWAVGSGITNGTSTTTFSPDDTCTRAQTVTFLWRAMGSPEPTGTSCLFTDVPADAYYFKAVLWAVENGITEGATATAFSPEDAVTRNQTVAFLWRAAGKPAVTSENPFSDVSIGTYYTDAVLWAVSENITEGTGAATFSPTEPCLRGQIAAFLYRDIEK